jgi:hypothetical protein
MSRLTVSPIARAVFTLMISSNLFGRSTGKPNASERPRFVERA